MKHPRFTEKGFLWPHWASLLHVDEVIALNDGRAHRDPYLNHKREESFHTVSNSSCLCLPLECMQGFIYSALKEKIAFYKH